MRPQNASLLGALAVALVVMFASRTSPMLGYFSALATLVMIMVAMHMESFWPTRARKENPLVFALFWGLMGGAILPFIVTTYLEGGASAVYEIFTSPP